MMLYLGTVPRCSSHAVVGLVNVGVNVGDYRMVSSDVSTSAQTWHIRFRICPWAVLAPQAKVKLLVTACLEFLPRVFL